MDFSSSNEALWHVVLQFGIIACITLLSNVIKLKVPLVRKSLLPSAVLAGFMMLLFRGIGLVHVDTDLMEMLMYHAIAIGFIALSLQIPMKSDKPVKGDFVAAKSGALIISTYLLQGLIGICISGGLAFTIMPNFFKAAGILLPMGFGQGSGQANNIGSTYEALGFIGGQSFGLSLAAMGYMVACVVGIVYLNIVIRRGKVNGSNYPTRNAVTIEDFESKNEPLVSESVDRFSIQIAMILLIYLFTYLTTFGIVTLLQLSAPGLAKSISPLLWGFNFIIGSLLAQACRMIF